MNQIEQQNEPVGSLSRKLIGWSCLLLGVVGVVMPIIPGIPFLLVGAVTLSTEHVWMRAFLIGAKRRLGKLWPKRVLIPRVLRRNSRLLRQPAQTGS